MADKVLFLDYRRQDEIDQFYDACQLQRDYYRGYPKAYHPLIYFSDLEYAFQCPPEMSHAYLSFPVRHVKYKYPTVLPGDFGRTSNIPRMPERTLGARYNKAACQAFSR